MMGSTSARCMDKRQKRTSFGPVFSLAGLLLLANTGCSSLSSPSQARAGAAKGQPVRPVLSRKPPSLCETLFVPRDDSEQLRWLQTRLLINTVLPGHKAPMLRVQSPHAAQETSSERSVSLPMLFEARTHIVLLYLWRAACQPCLEAWPSFVAQWKTYNNPKVQLVFLAEEGNLTKWRTSLLNPQLPAIPPNALQASTLGEPSCLLTPEAKRRPLLVALEQDVLRTQKHLDQEDTPLQVPQVEYRFVVRQAWEVPLSEAEWQTAQRVLKNLTDPPQRSLPFPKELTASWIEQSLLHAPAAAIAGLKQRLQQPSTSWVHVVRITPSSPTRAMQTDAETLQHTVLLSGSPNQPVSYQEIQSTTTWAPFRDIPVVLLLDRAGVIRAIVAGALQLDPSVPLGGPAQDTLRNRLYLEIDRGISNLLNFYRKTSYTE